MSVIVESGIDIGPGVTMGTSPSNVVTTGLQLYLDALDPTSYSGTGTTWYDLSGNGNDVIMQNSSSVTWNASGYFATGSNGWFSKASTTNLPTGNSNYTLSVWVQLGSSWGSNGLISVGSFGSSNQSNAFRASGTNTLLNYWWANDFSVNTSVSPTTSWFNAVARYDGTNRSILVNGVQIGTQTASGHNVTTNELQIAKTVSTEYLQGNIAQALIYNTALSNQDIIQNYDAIKTRFGL